MSATVRVTHQSSIRAAQAGPHPSGRADRQVRAQLLSPFISQKLGTFIASQNAKGLLTLRELIESGRITPAIDRIYPLTEAAIGYMLDGRARGKVVITV
jgi:NADPH:quinone reductase-like Zn-dependent oxidoreductase